MEGMLRPDDQPTGAFTLEAVRALRAHDRVDRAPLLLAYHPVARTNPYQALLYREAWSAGIAPVPLVREETIDELAALARAGHRTLLHLHWLNKPMARASSPTEAAAAGAAFLGRLDAYLATGGRLAWTIHNILPHGARFESEEARFRAEVAARADVIHVLARGTAEHVRPYFSVPDERILHVPHPAYHGAYEDHLGRDQARHELGLVADELVYLVIGAIQPYKGLSELLDAWDRIPFDRPRRLVIAGAPSRDSGIDELLDRAALHPTVVIHARKVPAAQMQLFLRAADVATFPYRRSLNSGALLLALTFGLPVIVPAGGGLEEVVNPTFARTFRTGDPGSLLAALGGAQELATPEAAAAALAAAQAHEPVTISRRFARGLLEMLERHPRPSAP